MKELLNFALENPALLVIPACGLVASLVLIRIKRRYIQEGKLFCRSSASARDMPPAGETAMPLDEASGGALKESGQVPGGSTNPEGPFAEQVWYAGLVILTNRTVRVASLLEHLHDNNLDAEGATAHIRTLLAQWRALKAAIDVSSVPARVRECVTKADGVARELSAQVDASQHGGAYLALAHRFFVAVRKIDSAANGAR
ncbi:hypothetical protein F6X37_30650 [Paraburkholderia sp. 31.1]|uniref:hypothetical protein n=1 Tax=Paraburkholderia sp. 31.1 TaxID=2615205 RepID=UPI001655814A|nr:hypothetical protein [Paraburkholderia sp. 31.1]MBC8725752.1 hypothetical protein [Paraburkholderia sp. 31.1]